MIRRIAETLALVLGGEALPDPQRGADAYYVTVVRTDGKLVVIYAECAEVYGDPYAFEGGYPKGDPRGRMLLYHWRDAGPTNPTCWIVMMQGALRSQMVQPERGEPFLVFLRSDERAAILTANRGWIHDDWAEIGGRFLAEGAQPWNRDWWTFDPALDEQTD
jgi:hypothetical protein